MSGLSFLSNISSPKFYYHKVKHYSLVSIFHAFSSFLLSTALQYLMIPREEVELDDVTSYVITVFTVFRLLTDFVCLYNYEFWLSLYKIVRSSVILLLPLSYNIFDNKIYIVCMCVYHGMCMCMCVWSFGPYNIVLVTDRSIYCHMTLSTMNYLLYMYVCMYIYVCMCVYVYICIRLKIKPYSVRIRF